MLKSFWKVIFLSVIDAVILGLVQGLGEFLPISSSAHLVLVPWFFGWNYAGLTFDVALHMGTLFSVVTFFWRDWLILAHDGLRLRRTREGMLFWCLVVATIPGAAVGYLLEEQAETILRAPLLIGVLLIAMGVVLYLADKLSPAVKNLNQLKFSDGIWIGISQALAIIPGVSRSGVTMTAGRILGLERETAARFSFLLSTPIIMGAGLFKLKDVTPADLNAPFLTGVVVSAVTGFLAIKYLLRYLTNNNFVIFVWYRFILGSVVIILSLFRG
jgi:undecaprenyl-diphosphatase